MHLCRNILGTFLFQGSGCYFEEDNMLKNRLVHWCRLRSVFKKSREIENQKLNLLWREGWCSTNSQILEMCACKRWDEIVFERTATEITNVYDDSNELGNAVIKTLKSILRGIEFNIVLLIRRDVGKRSTGAIREEIITLQSCILHGVSGYVE